MVTPPKSTPKPTTKTPSKSDPFKGVPSNAIGSAPGGRFIVPDGKGGTKVVGAMSSGGVTGGEKGGSSVGGRSGSGGNSNAQAEATEKARQEAEAKAQADAKVKTELQEFKRKLAVNVAGEGVYTSDQKFFPTTNPDFIPKGYERGDIVDKNFLITETKDGKLVKTSLYNAGKVIVPQNTVRNESQTSKQTVSSSVVAMANEPQGFENIIYQLERDISRLQTKQMRGEKLTFEENLKNVGLGIAEEVIYGIYGFTQVPKLAKRLVKNPVQTSKDIGQSVLDSAEEFGQEIKFNPSLTTGKVLGSVLFLKGSAEAGKLASDISSNVATRLSPKFKPIILTEADKKIIQDVPSTLKTTDIIKEYDLPGRQVLDIPIQESLPRMSLSIQAEMAGTVQNLVSGARDLFGTIRNRQRVISKPLGNEEVLTSKTRELLRQFDEGTLPSSKIPELNKRVIEETGSKGLLERSFFADPLGRLRPSRLGLVEADSATFLDYLAEDITFRKSKPQAILLEQETISKFPSSLKDIEKSLKEGKPLTVSQQDRLLIFELERGGGFKPIGFESLEAETTAFGGFLKREQTSALTLIKGTQPIAKRVPIIRASLVQPSKEIEVLLNKQVSRGLSEAETIKLERLLQKETGFDYSPQKKYVDLDKAYTKIIESFQASTMKSIEYSFNAIIKASSSPPRGYDSKPVYSTSASPTSKIDSSISALSLEPISTNILSPSPQYKSKTSGRTSSPPVSNIYPEIVLEPPVIPEPRMRQRKTKQASSLGAGYNVFVKAVKTNKFVRVNNYPLTKERAKDIGTYFVRETLARTFNIRPSGNPAQADYQFLYVPIGLFKATSGKLREFKIRNRSIIETPEQFIEKAVFSLDTEAEKRQLREFRKLAQQATKGF